MLRYSSVKRFFPPPTMLREDIERKNEELFRLLENKVDPNLLAEWQKNFRLLLAQACAYDPRTTILPAATGPKGVNGYEQRIIQVPRDCRKPNHSHDE